MFKIATWAKFLFKKLKKMKNQSKPNQKNTTQEDQVEPQARESAAQGNHLYTGPNHNSQDHRTANTYKCN